MLGRESERASSSHQPPTCEPRGHQLTFGFMNANPELLKRITVDDRICNGKPVIRGMRITAQTVLEFLMAGTPEDEVLKQYPMLEREDLEACRQFALSLMGNSFSVKDIAA